MVVGLGQKRISFPSLQVKSISFLYLRYCLLLKRAQSTATDVIAKWCRIIAYMRLQFPSARTTEFPWNLNCFWNNNKYLLVTPFLIFLLTLCHINKTPYLWKQVKIGWQQGYSVRISFKSIFKVTLLTYNIIFVT